MALDIAPLPQSASKAKVAAQHMKASKALGMEALSEAWATAYRAAKALKEVSELGDAVPAGMRDLSRCAAEDLDRHIKGIDALLRKADGRIVP